MATSSVVLVGTSDDVLTKEQKSFNRLTAKIAKLREQLLLWKQAHDEGRQRHTLEYRPLFDEFWALRLDMVRLFDSSLSVHKLTKTEQAKLRNEILSLTSSLLSSEDDHDELKAIHNRYSEIDYDEEKKLEQDSMKSLMGAMLGVKLGDDVDFNSPEEAMLKIQDILEQQVELEQAEAERTPARKKTAKQLAKDEQAQQFEEQANQSLREVYRKLVSSLHPDREPDPAERERKTALMQQLNTAYENKDLLALLELQLQIEQLDERALAAMSSERLKHFNKVLKEQVDELEHEVRVIQMALQYSLNMSPYDMPRTPKAVMKYLDEDILDIRGAIETIQSDLQAFQDVKELKLYLKTVAAPSKGRNPLFVFE